MQLNTKLAATASAVLGATQPPNATAEQAEWAYDITGFSYTESDDRVQDTALKLQATRRTESGQIMSFGVSHDALTGASAGGYVATDGSGKPRLSQIEDARNSITASLEQPLGAGLIGRIGVSYSAENDYQHKGVNMGISKELNNKNTTFNIGYAHSSDTIFAVGGNPQPGTLTNAGFDQLGEQDKRVDDLVVGVTQVLSKKVIAQLNYSYSQSSGYLNDAYKVVSVVDKNGVPQGYVHESRPNKRTGQGLYAALNIKQAKGVLKPSYRYFSDDWGIDSHTLEVKYAIELDGGRSIEPHIRYYRQNRANFYRGQRQANEPIAQHISSDYRLDAFSAITVGAQYRWPYSAGRKWRVGLELYHQSSGSNPDQFSGQSDLNPGIQAVMLRFGVSF